MATENQALEIQEPDEARPAKRVRLDAPLGVTEETQQEMADEDDWDDVYADPSAEKSATETVTNTASIDQPDSTATIHSNTASSAALTELQEHQYGVSVKENEEKKPEIMDGVPAEAIAQDDDLVAPPQPSSQNNDKASLDVMEEMTEIECHQPDIKMEELQGHNTGKVDGNMGDVQHANRPEDLDREQPRPVPKPADDPEFMAAAAAQKDNKKAERQFDSSDAESSSDSDSSDSDDSSDDSDSGSEGGYEMLDPATAAKILMSGDDGDDEGGKGKDKAGANHQPRTTNEAKEEVVVKPDVKVTEDMKVTFLGNVERTVENMVLIKGATPGEYQVLEGGSVLCNENREVIGAIADTFGRVQEPLYSVAFTNAKEIEDAGLEYGSKVYYVDSHSTFVFTQPLKNMKGTDASNIHDEEVGEDEMEFSDDEAEAEFKRQRKLAKKAGRGGLSRAAFQEGARTYGASGHDGGQTFVGGSDAPSQTYGGGMSYDDNEPAEDFYQPLKRPDNLSDLMAGRTLPPKPQLPAFDRGRGRGRGDRGRGDRGRGRGDRGRGRGGFEQRGGRGGGGRGNYQQNDSHRGNAQGFQNRQAGHRDTDRQHSLPPKPTAPHGASPPPPAQHPPPQWPALQFNGYPQFGAQAPVPAPPQHNAYWQQPPQPQYPAAPVPAGAYVNPAFFQQQANQQQQMQAQQQGYAAWGSHYQQQQQQYAHAYGAAPSTAGAVQNHQAPQQQQPPVEPEHQFNLSDILKRLGAN
ncbi:hypothetical protein M409DRAFT_48871 [Zasmidium cellare ATCC 36951]|uniref:H/ACA ribonucleoprotein complex non-core subunit NAF1 n=1 Tax=Zasmidium cellare ATCC 36951 TaxID=1080233 RepID=A0A6A6D722_ZASCE|nr:uncharacterized protein M409DRAFT_48871 [Zasmidium cellare ATCC 36951]KAF2173969.1 hypothetical protein M409DRAFT_48871 [Zasmidium cellare ATCC 36951]